MDRLMHEKEDKDMHYPQPGDRVAYSQQRHDDYMGACGPQFVGRRPNRGTVIETIEVGAGAALVWWDGQTRPGWGSGAGCLLSSGDLTVIGPSDHEWLWRLRRAAAEGRPMPRLD